MAELVDAPGSGSGGRTPVRVQIPLAAIHTLFLRVFFFYKVQLSLPENITEFTHKCFFVNIVLIREFFNSYEIFPFIGKLFRPQGGDKF